MLNSGRKNIIKTKDLRIFEFIEKYGGFFSDLSSKISKFYQACPENTPEKYNRYDPYGYWVQHIISLLNLDQLIRVMLFCKDLPVLNMDNSYVSYGNSDKIFWNSSEMLLDFLWKLYLGWKCALPILDELSSNDKYKVEDLEYELIFFFIDLIPVVKEILDFLYLWDKVNSLDSPITFRKSHCFYTIIYEEPLLISQIGFEKYIDCSREFWIKKIIGGVFLSKNLTEVLYEGLLRKIEYKSRIKDLDEKSAIEFVLREILSDVEDIRTLQFLGLNPPADFEAMRQRSHFTLKK